MKSILLQLDTDTHPSAFDRVVAVDAGVDEVFAYGGVTAENAVPLVHGAIFTRGPQDLKHTAVFVGGSDAAAADAVAEAVRGAFFGPMRVSLLVDPNGANTTAAAAVLSVKNHVRDLLGTTAVVFGATGPVGRRAATLLAREGAGVRVTSRSPDRALEVIGEVNAAAPGADVTAWAADNPTLLDGAAVVIAAGAAGVTFLTAERLRAAELVEVAVDLNAVPPAGLGGVEPGDRGEKRGPVRCYGALGVGGLKMKIHRAAVRRLFESNDADLGTAEVYALGAELAG